MQVYEERAANGFAPIEKYFPIADFIKKKRKKKKWFFFSSSLLSLSGGQHSFKSEHLLQVILQLPQHGFQLRNLLLQVAWRVTATERGIDISAPTFATDQTSNPKSRRTQLLYKHRARASLP